MTTENIRKDESEGKECRAAKKHKKLLKYLVGGDFTKLIKLNYSKGKTREERVREEAVEKEIMMISWVFLSKIEERCTRL
jgi:hypothetical protein